MRRFVRAVTAAVRLAAAARSGGDGTGAKIAQIGYSMQDSGTLLFQIAERLRHEILLL
jgi:hypothetical protein